MRSKFVIVCLLVLFLVGCSSNNEGKIEGTKWASESATIDGQLLPKGAFTVEFGEDGTLAYSAGPERYNGTYALLAGDRVKLDFETPILETKTHYEKIEISNEMMTITDSDKTSVKFSKAN